MSCSVFPALVRGLLSLLCVVCAFVTLPAASRAQFLDVEFTLSRERACVGEPIILDCKVLNPSSSEALVYLGNYGREWLTISLVDESGRQVPEQLISNPVGKQALQGRAPYVSAKSSLTRSFVLNRWFAIERPGNYRLRVHARLNHAQGPHIRQGSSEQVTKAGSVLEKERSFPFTVTQPDPVYLRSVAESLRAELVSNSYANQTQRLVESLLSMPATFAEQSWRALINNPRLAVHVQTTITGNLALFPSAKSADLLAWIVWSSTVPERSKPGIKNLLRRFLDQGDDDLKQHVGRLFLLKEGKLPKSKSAAEYEAEYGY